MQNKTRNTAKAIIDTVTQYEGLTATEYGLLLRDEFPKSDVTARVYQMETEGYLRSQMSPTDVKVFFVTDKQYVQKFNRRPYRSVLSAPTAAPVSTKNKTHVLYDTVAQYPKLNYRQYAALISTTSAAGVDVSALLTHGVRDGYIESEASPTGLNTYTRTAKPYVTHRKPTQIRRRTKKEIMNKLSPPKPVQAVPVQAVPVQAPTPAPVPVQCALPLTPPSLVEIKVQRTFSLLGQNVTEDQAREMYLALRNVFRGEHE